MPDFESSRARLLVATDLASRWHAFDTRKGKPTPYLAHLLQVEGLVIEHGGDPDQAIAALLHDSLEDAATPADRKGREEEIRTRFGLDVLQMILDCTDTTRTEASSTKGPWRVRKERYIANLRRAHARSLLVAACDKCHNLEDLVSDLRADGLGTFDRFSAGPLEQLWYFETLLGVFRNCVPPRLERRLSELVLVLRDAVPSAFGGP